MSGLPSAVKGTEPNASRNAVDDSLRDFYAAFRVLRGDGEGEVDDVALYFFDSHGATLSYMCARVCARVEHRIENHSRLDYVYIILIFFEKNSTFLFSQ